MPGSILQLTAIGIQDAFLTRQPEINVFQYSFYQYVNFATETHKLIPNEQPNFGKSITVDIEKRAHLVSKMHLHVRLPALTKVDGEYLSWCDSIGYAIFKGPVELEIGGIIVDRFYPHYAYMKDELKHGNLELGRNFGTVLKSDIHRTTRQNALHE